MFDSPVISNFMSARRSLALTYPKYKRLVLPILLVVLLINVDTREMTISVLADAFWQVSAFVALTLALYHGLGSKLLSKVDVGPNSSSLRQVSIATALGSMPGCGGAIIVITQYVQGSYSFGAVVSVLTATMGDAAFLLLAVKPEMGIIVVATTFMIGICSGLLVNRIHKQDFMRPDLLVNKLTGCCPSGETKLHKTGQTVFWQILLVPASIVALLTAFQFEMDQLVGFSEGTFAVIGSVLAVIAVVLWATSREVTNYESLVSEDPKEKSARLFHRIATDTNFVTSWVIIAFLAFELLVLYGGLDLKAMFSIIPAFVPLIAVVVGMVPGCGPQIVTTSLYISGAVPFSAQLGNAISNDGDALFPAIAMAPKVALLATLYSALPALAVAYGYFYFFE